MMPAPKVCEGPDCDAELPPPRRGGARRYCSSPCRRRAMLTRLADLTEKQCNICQGVKPIGDFYAPYKTECKDCEKARRRKDYQERDGREYVYAQSIKRLYGITLDEYEAMVEAQGGRCAICGEQPEERLRVDHDHDTGAVRELLCGPCNIALGGARDNPDLLRAMIAYLERHQVVMEASA